MKDKKKRVYIVLIWLIWNLLVFTVFGLDKQFARSDMRRVAERVLILLSYLGGGVGAISGMYIFRHKRQKLIFKITTPIAAVVSIILLISLLIV